MLRRHKSTVLWKHRVRVVKEARGTDVSTELHEWNGERLKDIVHWRLMETAKSRVAEVWRCPGGLELTR